MILIYEIIIPKQNLKDIAKRGKKEGRREGRRKKKKKGGQHLTPASRATLCG